MRNIITTSPAKLIPQAALVIPGIVTHGAALGFDATFEATLTAKKDELEAADSAYEQVRLARKNALVAKNAAMKNGRNHVRTVRELMRPRLTSAYSQSWDALGFSGSLSIPRSVEGMVLALNKMGSHLDATPALGAQDANLLAPKTVAFETALVNATAALNVLKSDVQRLYEARAATAGEMRYLLREVLSVLRLKLTPLDFRWVEFGFNKPGLQPTPDVPEKLSAIMIAPGTMMTKWKGAARAKYYRLWMRVPGLGEEMTPVGNTSKLTFTLEQVPVGIQVEVALSAVNDSGESLLSTAVLVQT